MVLGSFWFITILFSTSKAAVSEAEQWIITIVYLGNVKRLSKGRRREKKKEHTFLSQNHSTINGKIPLANKFSAKEIIMKFLRSLSKTTNKP